MKHCQANVPLSPWGIPRARMFDALPLRYLSATRGRDKPGAKRGYGAGWQTSSPFTIWQCSVVGSGFWFAFIRS